MSMKPTANIALAIALVACAATLGAWWGQRSSRSVATSQSNTSKAAVPSAKAVGPHIAFPRPIAAELAPAQPSSPANPASAPAAKASDIVPGGAVGGSAVDRMWETTANQAWQVRAAPITPPNWYITGVVQRGDKTQVIVQLDGEPAPRFLKIGDVLPGGSKLAWVRPGAIGVVTPHRKSIGVPVLSDTPPQALVPNSGAGKTASPPAR